MAHTSEKPFGKQDKVGRLLTRQIIACQKVEPPRAGFRWRRESECIGLHRLRHGILAFSGRPVPRCQPCRALSTDAETKILAVLGEMNQNQRRGMMSVPPDDGRCLRLLTESLAPKNGVEIGTSYGCSAVWLCLALRSTGGKLVTFEIDAQRAALARENFKRAGVDSIVTLVEGDAHKEVTSLKDPIDLLFPDADKEGYVDYLSQAA